MQTATTSQAVESANVLERLSKQYKDIFHVVQEKQAIMAGIAAEEARRGQDGDVNEEVQAALIRNRNLVQEVDSLQDKNRALQQELDASKVDSSLKIRKLESSMQTQEKLCRDSDAKISAECRKSAALEKERDELSKSVSTLNGIIASLQKKSVTSAEESTDLNSQLAKAQKAFNELQREHDAVLAKIEQQEAMFQELVPLEDYQRLQAQYQSLQKEIIRTTSGSWLCPYRCPYQTAKRPWSCSIRSAIYYNSWW
jgi:DNA repair exonuclease SbcCD ATPase subunit